MGKAWIDETTFGRWVQSIGRKLRVLEARGVPVVRRRPVTFWGVVRSTGPNGEADYTDARYWIERACGSNETGDIDTMATVGAVPENLPLPNGARQGATLEPQYQPARVVTATNIGELITASPAATPAVRGSHTLPAGTPVFVETMYDRQAGVSRTRRYIFRATTPQLLFPVKVTQVGGSAGDAATQCSFTYTVKNLAGVELGTAMTPVKRRPAVGKMSAGAADTIGLGFYGADGLFKLYDANETLFAEACAS